MHHSVMVFVCRVLREDELEGARVLEVGSRDINGTVRPYIESFDIKEYVGVDMVHGDGVDQVMDVTNLAEKFGEESFDIVVSTEVLEHTEDWKTAVENLKRVCKQGGILLLTTRSRGFYYHGYPHDYWRYQISDFKEIFSDFDIKALENDSQDPGVFMKAIKQPDINICSHTDHKLYSVVLGRRTGDSPVDVSVGSLQRLQIEYRESGLITLIERLLLMPHWLGAKVYQLFTD